MSERRLFHYKVRNVYSLLDLKRGDHIREKKLSGLYYHHMLVVEVIDDRAIKVIHYNGDLAESTVEDAVRFFSSASGFGSGPIAKVQQEVKRYSRTELSNLEVLSYPSSFGVSEDPIRRALSREGEAEYGLFRNNCESFANYCCIGRDVTPQGARAQHTLIGTGVGGATGGALGYLFGHAMAGSSKEDAETKRKIEIGATLGGALIGALVGYAAGNSYTESQFSDD